MKQLIVTGDDFGRSHAVNEAIERHHQAGLLTQASLMVNEPCADEARRIAQRHPSLAVGLHLTLCAGRAAVPSTLTGADGNFAVSPARAGLRYAFDPRTAAPLRHEIAAQFQRFQALGFSPSHCDGHTHLHLHPTILRLLIPHLAGFRGVRLVREPGNFTPVALIFRALSAAAQFALGPVGVRWTDRVYGLRATGRLTTEPCARILENLPDGLSELYFHPGAEPAELDLPRLTEIIARRGIRLTAFPDL